MIANAHYQVKVDVIGAQVLQARIDALSHNMMPCVIQLGGQPNLFSGYTRVFDALSHFCFIAICQRRIDVSVALLQGNFYGISDFVGLTLPGSKTNRWDFCTGI